LGRCHEATLSILGLARKDLIVAIFDLVGYLQG